MSVRELVIGLIVGLGLGAGISTVLAQDDVNSRPETIIRDGLAPTRTAPNGKARATLYAEGDNAFIGKISIRPGAGVPEHEDKSEEYLYVLKGKGTLTVDGTDYELKPRTGVYLPAGSTVKFQNGNKRFEAIQVFAPPDSANKYSSWQSGQRGISPGGSGSKKSKKKQ